MINDANAARGAIEAIEALHVKVECTDDEGEPHGFYACEHCTDHDEMSNSRVHEVWPCPTIQAIQNHLGSAS